MRIRLGRIFPMLAAALLLVCSAHAEDPLYPQLYRPVDLYMQRLAVMSQQDEVFSGIPYNAGTLTGRGCAPLSLANGLIAAFGVTDRDQARGVVLETASALAYKHRSDLHPVEAGSFPKLLDAQLREQEWDEFPVLYELISAYPGQISATSKALDAEETIAMLRALESPAILSARMYVNHSWEDVVRIAVDLDESGHRDALICLAYGGAGLSSSKAPLRSGNSGHYLTLVLHVGSFMESGTIYVLDSLPRALPGEPCGYDSIYRNAYAFPDDEPDNEFNSRYLPLRISPTVISLTFRPFAYTKMAQHYETAYESAEEEREAFIEMRTYHLRSMMIYGSCVMIITLPDGPL